MSEEEFVIFKQVGDVQSDPSRWVEGTISTTGEPYIDMPSKFMYTGKHKGVIYDEAKFDRIISNFREPANERDWSVPLQLDHDESSRSTIGNIRKLWRDGKDFWGTTRFVGEEAVRQAKNGQWRLLSPSVFPLSERLREVSVTPFPYLTGTATFSDSTESEDDMADKPKTDKAPNEGGSTQDTPRTYSQAAMDRILQEFNDKTAALEARVKKSEERNDELEKVVRFSEITREVDKFSDANKTSPAMREAELALLQTFSDEQMELYRSLKEKQPVVVDLDVHGDTDPEKVKQYKDQVSGSEDGMTDAQIDDLAKQYA